MASITLQPEKVVRLDIDDFYDGENLKLQINGGDASSIIMTLAAKRTGNDSDPEASYEFEPDGSGLVNITPAELAAVSEEGTLFYNLWEYDGSEWVLRAAGTVVKKAAIRPSRLPGNPNAVFAANIYEPGVFV
ncbi:MAG: hypothetical protein CMJ32_10905 [Phycisphaerae bacterium]|nr:hypothetical protein [Phycisphaerae bacterium]